MKRFRQQAILFIVLMTGMFLITVQIFPSTVVEGERQTQSSTTVCDDKTESCSTTICANGQPCVTTQNPPQTETSPKQDDSNNIPVEEQTPVEE
ncbi:MAG: hypothetical protein WB815_13895, partial [Nitrososphaeraceae archaeon]